MIPEPQLIFDLIPAELISSNYTILFRGPKIWNALPLSITSSPNNNNNQRYLVRVTLNSKADKPVALISGSNWNLECWFLWREENRRTRRKTLGAGTRTNNKLNPHVTLGPGIEPGPQ